MAAQFASVITLAIMVAEQTAIEHKAAAIKHTIANAVPDIVTATITATNTGEEPTTTAAVDNY